MHSVLGDKCGSDKQDKMQEEERPESGGESRKNCNKQLEITQQIQTVLGKREEVSLWNNLSSCKGWSLCKTELKKRS